MADKPTLAGKLLQLSDDKAARFFNGAPMDVLKKLWTLLPLANAGKLTGLHDYLTGTGNSIGTLGRQALQHTQMHRLSHIGRSSIQLECWAESLHPCHTSQMGWLAHLMGLSSMNAPHGCFAVGCCKWLARVR